MTEQKGNPKYDVTMVGKYGSGSCITDVYRVLNAFKVRSPELQHACKKILKVGDRGFKDERQDLVDILDSARAALEYYDDVHNDTVNCTLEDPEPEPEPWELDERFTSKHLFAVGECFIDFSDSITKGTTYAIYQNSGSYYVRDDSNSVLPLGGAVDHLLLTFNVLRRYFTSEDNWLDYGTYQCISSSAGFLGFTVGDYYTLYFSSNGAYVAYLLDDRDVQHNIQVNKLEDFHKCFTKE